MGTVKTLRCRECAYEHPPSKIAACQNCFAPVDVIYDYESMKLTRSSFEDRPKSIWRYFDLLPLKDKNAVIDLVAGYTPLVKADHLGRVLGLRSLYLKNDTVNPTFSFKDRPAGVGVSKAIEFGDTAIGCASTGNLAAAVAAHAAKAGLPCYVITPGSIEANKIAQILAYGANIVPIRGSYDDANRLAILASMEFGWNIINITSRPYYVEGSKTIAFEVCEQLGWDPPNHIIIPVASGALLRAIERGLQQFMDLGLIGEDHVKLTGAQGSGCAPVAQAFNAGSSVVKPVEHPKTIAKSIAIGDPGDGYYVLQTVRRTGGVVGEADDREIVSAIGLLARTEGIFTEPAGAVTIAVLRKMIEQGKVEKDERVVCCITGNGLKSAEVITGLEGIAPIDPTLEAIEKLIMVRGVGQG